MIKARFQQRQKGTLYKKGDVIIDHSEKQERELVSMGLAEYCRPKQRVYKNYPVKDENSSWYTLSNGKRVQGQENAERLQEEI